MRYIYQILSILISTGILIFTFQNLQQVTFDFLAFSFSAPTSLLFIGIYVLGMLTGSCVFGFIRNLYNKAVPALEINKKTPSSTNNQSNP